MERRESAMVWKFCRLKKWLPLPYVIYGTIYEDPDCSSAARLFFYIIHTVDPYGLECAQSVYPVSLPWFAEDFSGVQVWFTPDKLQNLDFYIHFGVWVVGKVFANSGEGFCQYWRWGILLVSGMSDVSKVFVEAFIEDTFGWPTYCSPYVVYVIKYHVGIKVPCGLMFLVF